MSLPRPSAFSYPRTAPPAHPAFFLSRVLAAVLLIVFSPFAVLLWAVVKIDSPGPFLFRQRRMGYLGRAFDVYKVRTMVEGAERRTALGTRSDGQEVTRLGRVLRKLKIDELPQLWNVVRGEMGIVGPRPIPLPLYDELCRMIPDFPMRNQVPPGLTSLSQISLAENKLGDGLLQDWRIRFEGELHYIRNKNVWYDLAIVVMTALFVVRRFWTSAVQSLRRGGSGSAGSKQNPRANRRAVRP